MASQCLPDIARGIAILTAAPSEKVIDDALVKAGIDPANEIERTRFCRLVAAEHELYICAQIAELGEFITEAKRHRGDECDRELLIQTACELRSQRQFDV